MVTTNLHVRLLMCARCVLERRHSRLQNKITTLSIRYKVLSFNVCFYILLENLIQEMRKM